MFFTDTLRSIVYIDVVKATVNINTARTTTTKKQRFVRKAEEDVLRSNHTEKKTYAYTHEYPCISTQEEEKKRYDDTNSEEWYSSLTSMNPSTGEKVQPSKSPDDHPRSTPTSHP